MTNEQLEQLSAYRQQGIDIGLCTDPINRDAAEDYARRLMKWMRREYKSTIFMDGPISAYVAALMIQSDADQVRDQVGAQVRAQVRDQVGDQVWAQVWDQVGDQVGDQVWDQVWDQVRVCAYHAIKEFFNLDYDHPAFNLIRLGIMVVRVKGIFKVFGKNGKYLGEFK